ncbi:DsbA family protein [Yinghuangia seranimata]|uniref:DsbA family protein n=1 Tax=Yinghuangia seranimata TaxID=408067 RepID=UPI00248AED7D|nr:DsbA family protein [Yinghuangia seranimata]MDI2132684.1 DsbA family protein [Yinghuangia seranimata]
MSSPRPPRVDIWCELQCPDCRTALTDLAALRARFGPELVVELRHFPLEKHKHAHIAAQAAEEARAQGALWPYVEAVLARVEDLAAAKGPAAERLLVEIAADLGLDADELELALIDGRHIFQVDADEAEGAAIGVKGTPTYEVAGEFLDAHLDQTGIRQRIEDLLTAQGH